MPVHRKSLMSLEFLFFVFSNFSRMSENTSMGNVFPNFSRMSEKRAMGNVFPSFAEMNLIKHLKQIDGRTISQGISIIVSLTAV